MWAAHGMEVWWWVGGRQGSEAMRRALWENYHHRIDGGETVVRSNTVGGYSVGKEGGKRAAPVVVCVFAPWRLCERE